MITLFDHLSTAICGYPGYVVSYTRYTFYKWYAVVILYMYVCIYTIYYIDKMNV